MKRIIVTLLMAGLVLAGCSSGGGPASEAPPAMTVKADISTSDKPDTPAVVDATASIVLEFNQPLNAGTIAGGVKLYKVTSAGDRIEEPCNIVFDGSAPKNLTINTADGKNLKEGEEYELVVSAGIESTTGLSLAQDFAGYFAPGYSFSLGSGGVAALEDSRTAVVCISDIHLGDGRSIAGGYGWMNKNRDALVGFLTALRQMPSVKELVIAGDMFDEWVAPMDVDPLNGGTESQFVDSIAAANQDIIDSLNNIIQDGMIKVTYVPGNHDMLVTSSDIQRLLPGVSEARDAQGLGAYSPVDRPEIIIEHGHRYDFYNAPDPISNRTITKSDSLLPPGFFVTKIAATSGLEHAPAAPGMGAVRDNPLNESQHNYFLYWSAWQIVMFQEPVTESWGAKIIKTGIDGYSDLYAINDLIPYDAGGTGTLDVNLYKGIQDTWPQRQAANRVAVAIPAAEAIAAGALNPVLDAQAAVQYFFNPDSDKRIVIFGHTHKTTMAAFTNHAGQKAIYANTGTWIDDSPDNKSPRMTFAVIIPQKSESSTTEYVTTYQYLPTGEVKQLASDAITNLK